MTLLITVNLSSIIYIASQKTSTVSNNEDIYIAAKQVSQYLIGSYYIKIDNGYHYTSIDNQDMVLAYDKHRLVKRNGYEILLHQIDGVQFQIKNALVYMTVKRNQKSYQFLVGYAREKKEVEDEILSETE